MSNQDYPVIVAQLTEEDGGGFVALAPDLHGCTADGETREEAVSAIVGAITEWIDEARRLGRDIPTPGYVAVRAKQERQNISDLVAAQEKLIRQQDELLEKQKAEIDRIKAEIALIDSERSEGDFMAWGGAVAQLQVSSGVLRKRMARLHNY